MEDEAREIIKQGVTDYINKMCQHAAITKATIFQVIEEIMVEEGYCEIIEETEEVLH